MSYGGSMTYRFVSAARRDIRKLEPSDARIIVSAIEAFASSGIGDVKKLKDCTPPAWRLRVGRFRVLFAREAAAIVVMRVSDRRDAYR